MGNALLCFLVFFVLLVADVAAKTKQDVLFISPAEIKAGRLVAESSCASCHGMSGSEDKNHIPRLAAQHADYLFAQLKLFQSGVRVPETKEHSLRSLSEEALKNASIYYSMQDLIVRDVTKDKAASKMSPMEAGKAAATVCASCHGETGNGTFSGMPRLTGKHQTYLVTAINAYKTGERDDAMMKMATASLSPLDIENISLYYAMQKPEGSDFKVNGDAEKGRELAAGCGGCHGEVGHSPSSTVPSLAGQDPAYLIKAVNAYKAGLRDHAIMRAAVEALTDKNIADISAYFAAQAPKAPKVTQPLTAVQIAEKCDRCHGINGNSLDRFIPSISAQSERYLISTLTAYKKGLRSNSMMVAMLEPLRDVDINALAAHYANKHRRAVVFADQMCD